VLGPNQFPLQIVKRGRAPFDGDDWLFEIKHDGFRVLAMMPGAQSLGRRWSSADIRVTVVGS
jgi:hypothetical protein